MRRKQLKGGFNLLVRENKVFHRTFQNCILRAEASLFFAPPAKKGFLHLRSNNLLIHNLHVARVEITNALIYLLGLRIKVMKREISCWILLPSIFSRRELLRR